MDERLSTLVKHIPSEAAVNLNYPMSTHTRAHGDFGGRVATSSLVATEPGTTNRDFQTLCNPVSVIRLG